MCTAYNNGICMYYDYIITVSLCSMLFCWSGYNEAEALEINMGLWNLLLIADLCDHWRHSKLCNVVYVIEQMFYVKILCFV